MRHTVTIAVELQAHVFMDQRLDGVAVVRCDDRQRTERTRLEAVDRSLTRFPVHTLIGGLIEPFARLAVHIMEIGKVSQRPEVLTHIADAAALNFAFLPSARWVTCSGIEVVFAGEREEARMKAHQASIMFSDGGG